MSECSYILEKDFFTEPEKKLPLDTAAELLVVLYNKSFVTNLPYPYGFLTKDFV